jgi:predicted nucleic acid-binding Zn ribbon protein
VLYPVAVHFKGSGFYTTDYGRGSGKKPSKDGDTSSPEPAKPKEEKKKAAEA